MPAPFLSVRKGTTPYWGEFQMDRYVGRATSGDKLQVRDALERGDPGLNLFVGLTWRGRGTKPKIDIFGSEPPFMSQPTQKKNGDK